MKVRVQLASLAIAYARSGYKTVLVDADIRNSVMSGFFKPITKITGLTDYLAGTTDLSQGLCDTDIPNLTVIESGKVSPNPTALYKVRILKIYLRLFVAIMIMLSLTVHH